MTAELEEDYVLTPEDPIAELRAEVTKLDTELRQELARETERADRAERELHALQETHRGDITLIGSVLMEEACDREWCDDYDRVIERLNDRLSVKLPLRQRNYNIDVRITYETTFDVLATSQEEAEQMVHNAERSLSWRVSSPFISSAVAQEGMYGHNVEVEVI
jgi:hypothetical protein